MPNRNAEKEKNRDVSPDLNLIEILSWDHKRAECK